MSATAWLDHDFPYEVASTPGLMFVGSVLDVDVYCLTDLDTAPLPVSDGATDGPDLITVSPLSGSGSPARAIDQRTAELVEQILDIVIPRPSQFYSYLIGELRRHRCEHLTDLQLEVLYAVVQRVITLDAARGGGR